MNNYNSYSAFLKQIWMKMMTKLVQLGNMMVLHLCSDQYKWAPREELGGGNGSRLKLHTINIHPQRESLVIGCTNKREYLEKKEVIHYGHAYKKSRSPTKNAKQIFLVSANHLHSFSPHPYIYPPASWSGYSTAIVQVYACLVSRRSIPSDWVRLEICLDTLSRCRLGH